MRRTVFPVLAAIALAVTIMAYSSAFGPMGQQRRNQDGGNTMLALRTIGQRSSQVSGEGARGVKRLDTGQSFYPRVIQLQHSGSANGRLVASASAFSRTELKDTDTARIFESTDGGGSFHPLSEIHDDQATRDRGSCCATLFELPQQYGAQPAGTLLLGVSVGLPVRPGDPIPSGRIPAVHVWKSADHGATWSYLSSCAVGSVFTPPDRGLWEPEFSIDARGDLDCYFSDETQAGYDQVIAMVTSTNGGVSWGPERLIVAREGADRPGMANIRRLPNNIWFMSYERCPGDCPVYYRTSTDGWNWGDPKDQGRLASTPDGKYLSHTPTIAWSPGGNANGRILLIGQLERDAGGKLLQPESGSTIFVNTEGGYGHWFELDAPLMLHFRVQRNNEPPDNELDCNNYSSSLLPSADGARVLELATGAWEGKCEAFFAIGSLTGTGNANGVASDTTYRLRNLQSAHCLDVARSSTAAGANVQQWTCNGASAQDWRLISDASGDFTLIAMASGKCLDVANGSTAAGANVQQWTCNGTNAQLWEAVGVGRSYYSFISNVSGLCLDVAGGSTVSGAYVQQWFCNHLAPQIWQLELR
jgi:hypothetical protein